MKTLMMFTIATVLVSTAVTAGAQTTKTVPGKTSRITASVEAIDSTNREVTVKKPDGTYDQWYIPTSVKRFDSLKVGDKVTATYYENVVLQVKAPSDTSVDRASAGVVRGEDKATGTMSHQRTITAAITAIDPNVPSISFSGPNNWKYSTRVQDKGALAKVKVGDRVDITWTQAMILSLDEGK
jgi:hypothetical protein